jgi:para-nitrobenzyl esterase
MMTMKRILFIAFALQLSLLTFAGEPTLTVQTKQGTVQGKEEHKISVWRGIQYAKAPVGDLRFRAPQPVDSWTGTKEAFVYSPVCPQYHGPMLDNQKESEDCLTLNIWSPAADGAKRPVMFWIHGGGFIGGSGSSELYDGAKLAAKGDVVIVTINYRLGPLGFLYFGKNHPEGFENNLGIKDQLAALRWVKDNIAAFGGDPETITLFGESAGAISVQTLMGIPEAKGLFKRAIVQSGNPDILWSADVATTVTNKFLKLVNVSPDNLQQLKTISADTLNYYLDKLLTELIKEPKINKLFAPTVDGVLIPEQLTASISKGSNQGIDLLIGTNKDEANLFATKRLGMAPTSAKQLTPYLVSLQDTTRIKLLDSYKAYPRRSGIMSLLTDATFAIPSIRYAELQSKYASTYMYRFDWSSIPLKLIKLRACHGIDVPFVFGNFESGMAKKIGTLANKKQIRHISATMQQAWLNFAKTGNPNGENVPEWKKYNSTQRNTLVFGKNIDTQVDPKANERTAWEGIDLFNEKPKLDAAEKSGTTSVGQ